MLKIRRSHDRLIFNMGIPIPGKDGLYIEMEDRTAIQILTLLTHGGEHGPGVPQGDRAASLHC